jgi:hypothetical protein
LPEAVVFEFTSGVTPDDYRAVNEILGLDPVTGTGDWPAGLLSHTGASSAGGGFMVFEVWESQQAQAAWMASHLGPALGQAGVAEPSRLEWLSVTGHHQP